MFFFYAWLFKINCEIYLIILLSASIKFHQATPMPLSGNQLRGADPQGPGGAHHPPAGSVAGQGERFEQRVGQLQQHDGEHVHPPVDYRAASGVGVGLGTSCSACDVTSRET